MKKVVFYARVSTDSSVQLHSLEEQRKYFMNYIQSNKDFVFVGEYVDEGITGTSMKNRDAFNRMIYDALIHKFDLILVKDISRFSRNTLDTIEQTRMLKQHDIDVIFINDHIDTSRSDGELNLTLLATMAQEESRKISNRVNWSMQAEIEKGVMYIESIYGYDVVDRQLVINDAEANVIKLIFNLYADGNGLHKISNRLYELKIPSPRGKERWNIATIANILENEKYIGILVSGKTHVYDFLTHNRITVPKEKQHYFENHHEAIIERELFDKVQMLRKQKYVSFKKEMNVFEGKLQCGYCGSYYKRESDYKTFYYCNNHMIKKNCDNNRSIHFIQMMSMLKDILLDLFNLDETKNKVIQTIKQSQDYQKFHERKVYLEKKNKQLNKRKNDNLEKFLSDNISIKVFQKNDRSISEEQKNIQNELNSIYSKNHLDQYSKSLEEIKFKVNKMIEDESLFKDLIRKVIDKIVIRNRNDFDVYLNTSAFKQTKFKLEHYDFIAEMNYDFSKYEIKYGSKRYKNLNNTKVKIFYLGGN